MAEDIRQHWEQGTDVLTTGLNSLANNTSATSSGVALGTGAVSAGDQQGPLELVGMVTAAGASGSNTGNIEIYAQFSRDGTNYVGTTNDRLVGVVRMNGTSTVRGTFRGVLAYPNVQIRLRNASGDALAASGNIVSLDSVSVDQA